MAIPLVDHSGDLVGVAQVLNTRKGVFDSADEQLGAGIASQAGIALRRAHLIQDHLDKVKLQQEMSVAKEIQESCFPKFLPAHPAFDIAAFSTPAEECGGDAFDVFAMRDGTIANSDEAADKVFFFLVTQLAMVLAPHSRRCKPEECFGSQLDLDKIGSDRP